MSIDFDLLAELVAKLRSYFGPVTVQVEAQTYVDDEGAATLAVWVMLPTTFPTGKALDLLEQFDNDFWDRCHDESHPIIVDIQYQDDLDCEGD